MLNKNGQFLILVLGLMVIIALTLTYGKTITQDIEEDSFSREMLAEQQQIDKIRFVETRNMIHMRMSPFLNYVFPGIKIVRINREYKCRDATAGYEGFMVEVALLSYWGIPTSYHAFNACGFIGIGRPPDRY